MPSPPRQPTKVWPLFVSENKDECLLRDNGNTMIRHILFIKFKDSVDSAQLDSVRALFSSMVDKVAGVEAVEWGDNDSPEGLNQGFTHCVLMTFADEAARQAYLPHPEHEALKAVFVPLVEDIVVLDYTL